VGTVNVGSRAPAWPLFYMALREGGGHCHERQAPPIRARLGLGRSGDPVPIRRSGVGRDHIPNKRLKNSSFIYLTLFAVMLSCLSQILGTYI
jgi:hypothetical protein